MPQTWTLDNGSSAPFLCTTMVHTVKTKTKMSSLKHHKHLPVFIFAAGG